MRHGQTQKIGEWIIPALVGVLLLVSTPANAQILTSGEDAPDPKGALWRSVVMPGWGHYYVNSSDWTRGKYHLAADVLMLVSYFGINARSSHLQQDMISYARLQAGTDVSGRSRGYKLAVGNFEDRQAYNEYNLRTRNWNELYPEAEAFRWNWSSTEAREEYRSLQDRIDQLDRQLPALFTLMVLNRVVSGVSAYLRARDVINSQPSVGLAPTQTGGMTTRIKIPL